MGRTFEQIPVGRNLNVLLTKEHHEKRLILNRSLKKKKYQFRNRYFKEKSINFEIDTFKEKKVSIRNRYFKKKSINFELILLKI